MNFDIAPVVVVMFVSVSGHFQINIVGAILVDAMGQGIFKFDVMISLI